MDENEKNLITFEKIPKRLILFNPFDVKSVHTGPDFTILLISDKINENIEGTSVDFIPNQPPMMNSNYHMQSSNINPHDEMHSSKEVQNKDMYSNNRGFSNKEKIDENSHLFHIFRLIVFLYEDLRTKLIKIIDENLNIDEILQQEYIDLIYR